MAYYVYILASRKDGATYIGITNDLVRRVYEHRTKAVRSFTSKYNITRLVWFEIYDDPISAISREKELKKWKRIWKTQLKRRTRSGMICMNPFVTDSSFRDGPKDQTSDVQLHIGESRDSGFASSTRPGMTRNTYAVAARSRRSAAARASAVISAPASMRAISSRR